MRLMLMPAEGRANAADRTRFVLIVDQGQMTFRNQFEPKAVDLHDPRVAFSVNRTGDRGRHIGSGHPHRDQVDEMIRFGTGALDDLYAHLLCNHR